MRATFLPAGGFLPRGLWRQAGAGFSRKQAHASPEQAHAGQRVQVGVMVAGGPVAVTSRPNVVVPPGGTLPL